MFTSKLNAFEWALKTCIWALTCLDLELGTVKCKAGFVFGFNKVL